jgi:hypothetical protein
MTTSDQIMSAVDGAMRSVGRTVGRAAEMTSEAALWAVPRSTASSAV